MKPKQIKAFDLKLKGLNHIEISKQLKISVQTLSKWFKAFDSDVYQKNKIIIKLEKRLNDLLETENYKIKDIDRLIRIIDRLKTSKT